MLSWQMACPGCLQGGGSNSKPFADFQHDIVSVLPINCVKCHYMARYQALVCCGPKMSILVQNQSASTSGSLRMSSAVTARELSQGSSGEADSTADRRNQIRSAGVMMSKVVLCF